MLKQKIEKNSCRLFIGPHCLVDKIEICRHKAHRVWMDQQTSAKTFLKQTQEVQFIREKCAFVSDSQAVVDYFITGFNFAFPAENASQ